MDESEFEEFEDFSSDSERLDRAGHPHHVLTKEEEKRYRYLCGDAELFDRFMEAKQRGVSPLEALTMHSRGGAEEDKKRKKRRLQHRLRRTESDEDADLIAAEVEDEEEGGGGGLTIASVFNESPAYVEGGKMRPYQVQGLNWLINLYEHGINGILADEMGLGKTLQTLSLLGYLKNYRSISGPHLLVVPKSTLQNWQNEVRRWVPSLRAFVFHGDKDVRSHLVKQYLVGTGGGSGAGISGADKMAYPFDVCITSYEICLAERAPLRKVFWEYLIIDEAHRIKNEASKLAGLVRELRSRRRLLITGTPLQNNLRELWALLNFLLPDIFGVAEEFEEWFTATATSTSGTQDVMVQSLRRLLQPFLLRRLKADVEHSLLPKREVNLYVGMSTMQKQWYRRVLERDLAAVNGLVRGSQGRVTLLNVVMQLRKCCNHPYLFDGAEPGPPYTTGEHLVSSAGKLAALDGLLKRLRARGSRVLLFSQMSRMLDILEDYCGMRGWEYCRIDGQTAHEDRVAAIDEYNRPNSDKFVFLLTTRAGGLGINLATADVVILYDSDWNPQVDLQAQDRAHRIGQTKQVCVFRLVTEHSIEEKIIEKAWQKLRLDQLVIQQGKLTNLNKPLTSDEMLAMIRHGAEKIITAEGGGTGSDGEENVDIEDLLLRGEERTKELLGKYANVGYEDLQKFSIETTPTLMEPLKTAQGDDDQGGGESNNDLNVLSMMFLQPAKRERKGTYHVDAYYREALRMHPPKAKAARAPVPKDHFVPQDWQFYGAGLEELLRKEALNYQREVGYKVSLADLEARKGGSGGGGGGGGGGGDEETKKKKSRDQFTEQSQDLSEAQKEIDRAKPLTEKEEELKARCMAEGFRDWTRRDYFAFLRAVEKHGRDATKCVEMEGKSREEAERYGRVFWGRWKELSDAGKIEGFLEAVEARNARSEHIRMVLQQKLAKQRKGKHDLRVVYSGHGRGKQWSEGEDQFLLQCMIEEPEIVIEQEGMKSLKRRIEEEALFRFDWFIRTRSEVELSRRCGRIIGFCEREVGGGGSGGGGGGTTTRTDEAEDEKVVVEGKKKKKGGAAVNGDKKKTKASKGRGEKGNKKVRVN